VPLSPATSLVDRDVIDAIDEDLLVIDRDYHVCDLNETALRTLGVSREQAIGRRCHELVRGCARPCHLTGDACGLARVFETGQACSVAHERLDANGARRHLSVLCSPLRDARGELTHVVEAMRDITALVEAAERKHRRILETATDGFWMTDRDSRICEVNDAYCRMSGYSAGELLGRSVVELDTQVTSAEISRLIETVVAGSGARFLSRHRRKDGSLFDVEVSVQYLPENERFVSFVRDVTERLRAEAALRESEEGHRLLHEAAGVGIGVYTPEGRVLSYNRIASRYMGGEPEDYVGRSVHELFPPAAAEEYLARIRRATAEERREYEDRIELPTGPRWFQSVFTRVVDSQGRVNVQIISTDISARKRAEEALRQERWRLQSIIEGTRVGTWEWDVQTGETLFDERWAGILGRTLGELAPISIKTWEDLAHPDDLRRSRQLLERHFAGELPYYDIECRMRHKDGRWVWVHDRGRLITRTADGKPWMMFGTHADISERKAAEAERLRLEEELRHAQKMEAIGTLAGGVAHDFNNILGGIMGGLSLLELELGDAENAAHRTEILEMKALVERGADLAKQLLGLGRRGKYDVRPLDLGGVVRRIGAMFGRTRQDVTVSCELAPGLLAVMMDHTQLEQVLLNLALNAGQAMPRGGRLLLRAENTTLAEGDRPGAAPGRYVKLHVEDSGIGMDAATRERIFEPFFTTKEVGRGSGLGLASVYGIVKNHGGAIGVASEPGVGTVFTLHLPATEERPAGVVPTTVGAAGRGETILVVDDEEPIARVCSRMLRKKGYEVLTAVGGRAALELLREHPEVALVILDLTMPELGGAATYDAIRASAPTVKVLLASGFAEDAQARELLERGCDGFIQKPFDLATLADTVRTLL
jgi:PAS domain S-box-containing protein